MTQTADTGKKVTQPELVTLVFACFLRAVSTYLRRSARKLGVLNGHTASVTWIQRFGDALRLNVHAHALLPNGVFVESPDGSLTFREVPPPTDAEVEALCRAMATRVPQILRRRGYF